LSINVLLLLLLMLQVGLLVDGVGGAMRRLLRLLFRAATEKRIDCRGRTVPVVRQSVGVNCCYMAVADVPAVASVAVVVVAAAASCRLPPHG
jgi:hypothetical protein